MKPPESGSRGGGSSQAADGWWTSLAKDAVPGAALGCQTNLRSPFFWGQEAGGAQSRVREGRAALTGQALSCTPSQNRGQRAECPAVGRSGSRKRVGNPSPQKSSSS